MKKLFYCFSVIFFTFFSITSFADTWDGTAKKWTSGTGTSSDPYLIASAANLAYLSAMVESGTNYKGVYFKQTVDINLNNLEWTPIGVYSEVYSASVFFQVFTMEEIKVSQI